MEQIAVFVVVIIVLVGVAFLFEHISWRLWMRRQMRNDVSRADIEAHSESHKKLRHFLNRE